MSEKPDAVAIAQAWQGHRILCVKLAIKAGASVENVVEIAAKIDAYIITKSVLETPQAKP
jgi:hypothetical protein